MTRVPPGHPEGYLEGFANIYSDIAEVVTARPEGRDPGAGGFPTVEDGVRGVKFIEAPVESSARGGVWVDAGGGSLSKQDRTAASEPRSPRAVSKGRYVSRGRYFTLYSRV